MSILAVCNATFCISFPPVSTEVSNKKLPEEKIYFFKKYNSTSPGDFAVTRDLEWGDSRDTPRLVADFAVHVFLSTN